MPTILDTAAIAGTDLTQLAVEQFDRHLWVKPLDDLRRGGHLLVSIFSPNIRYVAKADALRHWDVYNVRLAEETSTSRVITLMLRNRSITGYDRALLEREDPKTGWLQRRVVSLFPTHNELGNETLSPRRAGRVYMQEYFVKARLMAGHDDPFVKQYRLGTFVDAFHAAQNDADRVRVILDATEYLAGD